jgi:hypothetical protein
MVACAAAGQGNLELLQHLLGLLPAPDASGRKPALSLVLFAVAGARPKFVHPSYGWSVKFIPSYQPQVNRHNVIAQLVQLGADVNADDSAALRAADKLHDTALVKFLWEQGANGKGDDGQLLGTSLVNGPQRPAYPPEVEHMMRSLRMMADR